MGWTLASPVDAQRWVMDTIHLCSLSLPTYDITND